MGLQALRGLSDREAAEAVRCNLRWKVACGLPFDRGGIHPTTLTYWRRRLAGSDRPNRIFDAVRDVVTATGVLAVRAQRAMDSVVFDDAVASRRTAIQLVSAVRRVARGVHGAADLVANRCNAHDYTDPGRPSIAWNGPAARQALVSALVNDALILLEALAGGEHDEDSDGTDGRWRIARKVAPDRTVPVVDPQARHVHKTVSQRQDGYKGHLAVELDTGLFLASRLTQATGADNTEAAVAVDLLGDEPAGLEVLVDRACSTGEARRPDRRRTYLYGQTPPPRPAVAGRYTVDAFVVNKHTGTVTCPNGAMRTITARRTAVFGVACTTCPLHHQRIRPHPAPHDRLLCQARQDWTGDSRIRDTYRRRRPMVEWSIAWLVDPRGCRRKLRYLCATASNQWLHTLMAALNLRRLYTGVS